MWGFITRADSLKDPSRADTGLMFVGGLALALGAWIFLAVADRLNGPPLISAIPVMAELPLMGLIGALFGSRVWTLLAPTSDSGSLNT